MSVGSENVFVVEDNKLESYDSSLGLYVVNTKEEDNSKEPASWHDNWLFRQPEIIKAKKAINTVTMLLPNATDDIKAQIGNKDFDLVSELTENLLDEGRSDDDTDMNDNIDIEQPEKDNEYMIYEMMIPVRLCNDNINSVYHHVTNNESSMAYGMNSTPYNLCKGCRTQKISNRSNMLDPSETGYLWLGEEIGESSTDDIPLNNRYCSRS